ncbi:cell wall-binding repeat-containing protein [Euzebya rosea]|uniref:cell wall-binding repeat-containing protein n=1 Tax=Euzebya rosea TaxID=2052804 RepID=UPI000D3E97FF|nr:cell wall-binding repeat-containing protein [Euzebya rosea]
MTVVAVALVAAVLTALPASASEECLADADGDLVDLVTGNTATNPNGDLRAMCVTHSPGTLVLHARLGGATDVATHPAWEPGRSALVFQVDVDPPAPGGEGTHEYDVVIGRAAGEPAWTVQRADDGEVVCGDVFPADGLPTDRLPTFDLTLATADCLPTPDGAAPSAVRVGTFLIFAEAGSNSTLDEMPSATELYGGTVDTAPRPDEVPHAGVIRVDGRTRIETAIAVSQQAFPAEDSAGAVVLATGRPPTADGTAPVSSPDALAAAPLATHVGGPVLLVGSPGPGQLAGDVLAEIDRVLAPGSTVYLVGGDAVLHSSVADDLTAAGYTARRLAGLSRESTSLAVALEIDRDPTRIVLVDGSRFEHALLGAAYAAQANALPTGPDGGPAGHAVLLLTTRDEQGQPSLHHTHPGYVRTDRPGRQIVTIGHAATQAAQAAGLSVAPEDQLVAPDDDVFATSLLVADRYVDGRPTPTPVATAEGTEPLPGIAAPAVPTSVVVTSGVDFPDALGGAALAGRYGVPLLFSWPDSLPGPTRAWLRALPNRIDPGFVIGGPAALRDGVAAQLSGCGTDPVDQRTAECRPARRE